MRRIWLCSRKALAVLGLMIATGVIASTLAGTASAKPGNVGAVYVQSNTPRNVVRVFYRSANGQLTRGPKVSTGGAGSSPVATGGFTNPPFGLAITDSQNSVVLTQDNRVLLVTNNGSNTISSFRVLRDGNIVLADQKSSRGLVPNSIAVTDTGKKESLVYVLNEGSETVFGFTVDRQGNLTAIPRSMRPVSGTFSATVGFNSSGRVLTVTNRNEVFGSQSDPKLGPNGSISTFPVNPSTGLLGPEVVTPATGTGAPFGFEYTKQDELLVANSGQFNTGFAGSASSYELNKKSAAVTARDVEPTGGITCWVAITNNNKFAYFTSPGTLDVTGFQITSRSQLVPIGKWGTKGSPLDVDTSADSKYLYVLNTNLDFMTFAFTASRITVYEIDNVSGHLAEIGSTRAGRGGNSGLAAF